MTAPAFLLLLISVFLHAGWNFLSKKKVPSLAFFAISTSSAALLWLPGFFLAGPALIGELSPRFWLLYGGSVGCEVLYFSGLAYAYRRGDITLVYPMARALPVIMTASLTILFGLGSPPGPAALAGMIVLSVGCMMMPLARWRDFTPGTYRGKALRFILLASLGTTGYTVLDSLAIRLIMQVNEKSVIAGSLCYLFLLEAGIAVVMLTLVAHSRPERREFGKLFLKSKTAVISGIFSSLAYVLILLAMGFVSNVSYVQAFRQMSLPICVLAGIFLLHEKVSAPRLAGILLVIAGLTIVSIGA